MNKLNFYDVDKKYIAYLKKIEIDARGFTCVPDMEACQKYSDKNI